MLAFSTFINIWKKIDALNSEILSHRAGWLMNYVIILYGDNLFMHAMQRRSIPVQFPFSSFCVLLTHKQSYEPMLFTQMDDGGQ